MLTRIVCPNCGHVGSTSALLPRVLVCSQCGHSGLIMSGRPARSPTITREDQAAGRAMTTPTGDERAPPDEATGRNQDTTSQLRRNRYDSHQVQAFNRGIPVGARPTGVKRRP
jgi:hypothetical protein